MARVNVYLSDELAERVRQSGVPVSAVCQEALRRAVEEVEPVSEHQVLSVVVGGDKHEERFRGTWLVEPDPARTRGGPNEGIYWGVARTARGNVAVYEAHVEDRWPAHLEIYRSLERAQLVPEIEAMLSAGAVWRDI